VKPSSVFLVIGADRKNGSPNLPAVVNETVDVLRSVGWSVSVGVVDDRTSVLGILRNVRILRNEVAQTNPCIIHAQYGSVTSAVARLIAGSLPLVVSFRGDDLLGTPIPGVVWRVRERLAKCIGIWGACDASAIITVSENLWTALPGELKSKARILPFGVDINFFRPMDSDECRRKLGWDRKSKIILFNASSGTNQNVKNLALAQETVTRLTKLIPNVKLHSMSTANRQEVCWMMNASDCLLVTSLHEGSPGVVKEAMACNLPIVSVPCGDVVQRLNMVKPGAVCPYDVADLADAILKVIQNGERSNGRDQVFLQKLTRQDFGQQLTQLYCQILANTNQVQGLKY